VSATGARPWRVLIADASREERALVAAFLKQEGYQTFEAEDGVSALAAIRLGLIDVALLEMGMPGMNGTEVLSEVRKLTKSLPVILFADSGSLDLAEGAMKHGADMYLTKPIWKDELLGSIQKALQDRQARVGFVSPREREARIRQSQRMEVLGRLASGVAHDLNNLITVMVGYSQILLHHLEPDSPLRSDLREIQKAGDRAAALTRQLLAFGRKQEPAPLLLDLNTLVAGMDLMLRRLIREDIDLVLLLEPALGRTKIDQGHIEQVVMNLVLNARDAMPQGGRLTVRTANVVVDDVSAERHPGLARGEYVMLAVSDNGCGMDAFTQAHLFEPFFTTKDQGRGTGLGLCIVWDILHQSGGGIEVDSEAGRGSTFTVFLPRVKETDVPPAAAPFPAALPPRGCETVLVVEDNENIRSLVREILLRSDYKVLEARQGGEALALAEDCAGPIDLLVTDVVMPQMSARELARRLGQRYPRIKILYMSGYAPPELEDYNLLSADIPFIEKPFTPDAFAHKVREVLDGSSPPHPASPA
jgi:two-component system cell cycle sensor histidine kinase/response regulator CckA